MLQDMMGRFQALVSARAAMVVTVKSDLTMIFHTLVTA